MLAARTTTLVGNDLSTSIADRMDGRMKMLKSFDKSAVIETAIPNATEDQKEALLKALGARIKFTGKSDTPVKTQEVIIDKPRPSRGLVGLIALMEAGKEACAI